MAKRSLQMLCCSLLGMFLLGVLGCAEKKPLTQAEYPWKSYKCTAVGMDYRGTGWATDEETARVSALAKCQDNTTGSGTCRVTECHAEKPSKTPPTQ